MFESSRISQVNTAAKEDKNIHDEAREYFKRMESGDEEALKMWRVR